LQDFVKSALKISSEDSRTEVEKKLEAVTDENHKKIINHWLGLQLDYEQPALASEELEKARRETLVSLLDDKPKLLVFNDVHWADESSLATIEWLTKRLPENTIVTTNYRPNEIIRNVQGDNIEVGALSKDGVGEFTSHLTGERTSDALTNFVYRQSKGVPLHVEEIVDYIEEAGALTDGRLCDSVEFVRNSLGIEEDEDKGSQRTKLETVKDQDDLKVIHDWLGLDVGYAKLELAGDELEAARAKAVLGLLQLKVPKSITELVQQRYNNLQGDKALKQRVLDYSACMFEEEFSKKLLETAMGAQEGELDDALEELAEADFLKLNGHVRFKHNLTREAVYGRRRETLRTETHREIGDARKELFGANTEDQLVALAYDYFHGDDIGKNTDANLEAARWFIRSDQHREGLIFTERIASISEDKITTPEARKNYSLVLNARAFAFQNLDRVAEAEAAYETAFAFTRKLGDEGIEALGNLHINRGLFRANIKEDRKGALQDYEAALPLTQQTNDRDGEGLVVLNISACQEGNERIKTTHEAINILKEFGNTPNLALAYINLFDPLLDEERYEEANNAAEQALEISRSIRNPALEGRSIVGLAIIANKRGDYTLADTKMEEAKELFERVQNLELLSLHYSNWIEFCIEREDYQKGLDLCNRWLALPISAKRREKIEKRKKKLRKNAN